MQQAALLTGAACKFILICPVPNIKNLNNEDITKKFLDLISRYFYNNPIIVSSSINLSLIM